MTEGLGHLSFSGFHEADGNSLAPPSFYGYRAAFIDPHSHLHPLPPPPIALASKGKQVWSQLSSVVS